MVAKGSTAGRHDFTFKVNVLPFQLDFYFFSNFHYCLERKWQMFFFLQTTDNSGNLLASKATKVSWATYILP